jgi:hypothetical protein
MQQPALASRRASGRLDVGTQVRISAARPGRPHLQQIGDRVPVALDRGEVVPERSAFDPAQMPAARIGPQRQVGDAARFPEAHRLAPLGRAGR